MKTPVIAQDFVTNIFENNSSKFEFFHRKLFLKILKIIPQIEFINHLFFTNYARNSEFINEKLLSF